MTNPQSLNRFSYVLNNPIRYTDPTGHCPGVKPGIKCVANPKITTASVVSIVTLPQPTNTIILNPTHVDAQGNIIIAVPVQQPSDSPSVPTITTLTNSTSSSFEILSFEKGPLHETRWSPPISLKRFEYILGIEHYINGEPVVSTNFQLALYYPDEGRVIEESTTTITTVTTYDQNGNVLNVNEVESSSSFEQFQIKYSEESNAPLHYWMPFNNNTPNIVYR